MKGNPRPLQPVLAVLPIAIVFVVSISLSASAFALPVPLDYRANTSAKIVNLKNYDGVNPATNETGIAERPYGPINFENGSDVPALWHIWFLDPTKQIVGTINTEEGSYNFNSDLIIFGDNPDTTVKEGARDGDNVTVIIENFANHFFISYFIDSFNFNPNYEIPFVAPINVTEKQILASDVNNDCTVDIFDLAAVGLAYGSNSSSANWNEWADVKVDGVADLFDLASVGLEFGSNCTS